MMRLVFSLLNQNWSVYLQFKNDVLGPFIHKVLFFFSHYVTLSSTACFTTVDYLILIVTLKMHVM